MLLIIKNVQVTDNLAYIVFCINFYYCRFGSMYFILPHYQDNKIVNTSSLKEDGVSKIFLFRLDLCY